ncbi:hypothetical protein RG393_003806 [Morganella morganii]|nr:hypothetical protein [Morganella morganii]
MDNEILRDEFEQWVMTKIIISKSTLVGLRTDDGYRNTTLSGRDYNSMWEAWVASRSALKPVGYLSATASVCLRRGKQTIVTPEDEGNCTPLYRLDK